MPTHSTQESSILGARSPSTNTRVATSRTPSFFPNRCSTFSFSNWRSMLALLNSRFSKSAISEAPFSPVPSLRTKPPAKHYASAPVLPSLAKISLRSHPLRQIYAPSILANKAVGYHYLRAGSGRVLRSRGRKKTRRVPRVPRPQSASRLDWLLWLFNNQLFDKDARPGSSKDLSLLFPGVWHSSR